MTESNILRWIKDNLSGYIDQAIIDSNYSQDLLAGMTMRETGFLIARYIGEGKTPEEIHKLMKGDYSQRKEETEKQYHGYGYIQIDIGSYPDFIKSGDWQDPLKSYKKAVAVLNEKSVELGKYNIHALEAIVAAYNCGAYNARRALEKGNDVDLYTYQHNYSKEVDRYRGLYLTLS